MHRPCSGSLRIIGYFLCFFLLCISFFFLIGSGSYAALPALPKSRAFDFTDIGGKTPQVTDLVIEAEDVSVNKNNNSLHATGNVVATKNGYKLISDDLFYYKSLKKIEAIGHVRGYDGLDDIMLFGSKIISNPDFTKIHILDIQTVFISNGSSITGNTGDKITEGGSSIYKIHDGLFSTCPLPRRVNAGANSSVPVTKNQFPWSASGSIITYDEDEEMLYFKNFFFNIYGTPVIYSPYFSRSTNQDRKTGFLTPSATLSGTHQMGIIIPFYVNIAENKDLTITPTIYYNASNSAGNSATNNASSQTANNYRNKLAVQYRHLLYEGGYYEVNGSVIKSNAIDNNTGLEKVTINNVTGQEEYKTANRWYFNTFGDFSLNEFVPHKEEMDNTYVGYNFAKTSDTSYLFKYEQKFDSYFTNKIYTRDVTKDSYNSMELVSFNSALLNVNQLTTPRVLPLVNSNYTTAKDKFGGSFNFDGNLVALERQEGLNSKRLSESVSYNIPTITKYGEKFEFGLRLHNDNYNFSNDNPNTESSVPQGTKARNYSEITAETSYPFFRPGEFVNLIIEPKFNIVKRDIYADSSLIPNEDSYNTQLSYSNLFAYNKYDGFDQVEEGTRANYGVNTTLFNSNGIESQFFVGRSRRLSSGADNNFAQQTGLADKDSDYVGIFTFKTKTLLSVTNQFRLQDSTINPFDKNFKPYRNFTYINLNLDRVRFGVNFSRVDKEASASGHDPVKTLAYNVSIKLTSKYSLNFDAMKNLIPTATSPGGPTKGRWVATNASLLYTGACINWIVTLSRNGIGIGEMKPATVIQFNVGFNGL